MKYNGWEYRRCFLIANLHIYVAGDLEHQFTVLREQLYQERVRQIEMNLIELRNGRSQEYLEPLKQLTDAMERRVEVAGILRNYRLENVSHKFCAEEQGARQHFEVSEILQTCLVYFEVNKLHINSNY